MSTPEDQMRANRRDKQKNREEAVKKNITIAVSPGDIKVIEEIKERLGVNMSEAVRTALRVYAAILKRP